MRGMFSGTTAFSPISLSWDVGRVTDMGSMFSLAGSFNGDISSWDVTSVTNMPNMFYRANSLIAIFPGGMSVVSQP